MESGELSHLIELIQTAQWRIGQANDQATSLKAFATYIRVVATIHSMILPAIVDPSITCKLSAELRCMLDSADRIEGLAY